MPKKKKISNRNTDNSISFCIVIEDFFFSSTGKLCAEKVREQNEMGEKGRKSRIKGGLFTQERPSGSLGTSEGGENAAVLAVTFSFSSREVCYLAML